jgi:protein TonB
MKRGLSLAGAFAVSLGAHLALAAACLSLAAPSAPKAPPARKLLVVDEIGLIALREQEARVAEPEAPPPEPVPPPPEPEPPPPPPEPEPPPVPEAPKPPPPAPKPRPRRAPAAAAPPPARVARAEESRAAQRLAEVEAAQLMLRERYLKEVMRKLERHLRYPLAARLAGETGRVSVRFSVAPDGSVHSIALQRSSGHPALDAAALDAVRRAAPFPPSPFDGERECATTLNFEEVKGKEDRASRTRDGRDG